MEKSRGVTNSIEAMDNEGPNPKVDPGMLAHADEKLSDDVSKCLSEDAKLDASRIRFDISAGEITLFGVVPDENMREYAAERVSKLPGVKGVRNHLVVRQVA
ncbi:MAG: BON domain-containing protein [Bacteriovoracia bacterium]